MKISSLDSAPIPWIKKFDELAAFIASWEQRPEPGDANCVEYIVRAIIDDVHGNGDKALIKYTKKFDKCALAPKGLKVSQKEFTEAGRKVSPQIKKLLKETLSNITAFHSRQKRESWTHRDKRGFSVAERYVPVARAGVYVPGGTAPLISTVFMTVVPAKTAGVGEVIVCTPPDRNGKVNPYILYAARLAGADAVYKAGGAQAIAAMAYGTKTIPRVDKICGPGNVFVSTAKKLVFGDVGIDMIAGPSEVAVIADATTDADFAAADLLSQLEHDTRSSAFLVCAGKGAAAKTAEIKAALKSQSERLSRGDIVRQSTNENLWFIEAPKSADAVRIADLIAPEHLEIMTADADALAAKVRNCSAIFTGSQTCVPLGDFWAGPSHVLPTGRSARFSSGLNVSDFLKTQNIIRFDAKGVKAALPAIRFFGIAEGLDGHLNCVLERANKTGK